MKQSRISLVLFIAGLTAIVGTAFFGHVLAITDSMALLIHALTKAPTTTAKVYAATVAVLTVPIILAVLPELEQRRRHAGPGTLVQHLLIVVVVLAGIQALVHAIAYLSIKDIGAAPWQAIPWLTASIAALYASARVKYWQPPVAGQESLKRGVEVIFDPRKAESLFRKRSEALKADGILLHDAVRLPLNQESKHALLIAAPGAGKTQVIYPLIERIRQRGDPIVLYDFKGDFTAAFGGDPDVTILTPFDDRGCGWNIAADLTTELKALEFAAQLMPDHESREPFFRKAAQDLLCGVICRLNDGAPKVWSLSHLVDILGDKEKVLFACSQYRPAALTALGPPDGKQASSVFGELRTATIQLEYLAKAWPNQQAAITLTEWVRSATLRARMPVIILKGDQQYRRLDGFLTAQVFATMIKEALALPDSYERRIWFILDEFGNLPKIDGIDAMITGVRSKGVRVVAAIQDIAQIEATYSKEFAQTFFNCFGTILAGLCSGPTARYLADAFGRNKIERVQSSESHQRRSSGLGRSASKSETRQSVVESAMLDTDFANLEPPGSGKPASFWLRISGWPIGRLAFPIRPLPTAYPAHIAPAWLGEGTTRVSRQEEAKPPTPPAPTLVKVYQPGEEAPC